MLQFFIFPYVGGLYVAFILSLFLMCLGKAVVRD